MMKFKGMKMRRNVHRVNGTLVAESITFGVLASVVALARLTESGPEMIRSENASLILFFLSRMCWPNGKHALRNRLPAYSASAVMFIAAVARGSAIVQVSLYGLAMALVIIGLILCHKEPTNSESLS